MIMGADFCKYFICFKLTTNDHCKNNDYISDAKNNLETTPLLIKDIEDKMVLSIDDENIEWIIL